MKLDIEKTEIALNVATTQISELIVSLNSQVADIEEKYKGVIPDASTKEGYDTCKAIRKEVMPTKTALEKARVTLKGPITEAGKFIDQSFNPLIERALNVYKPFVDAYQEVDKEKQRFENLRLAEVTEQLYHISNIAMSCIGKTSIVIAATIEEFSEFQIDSKIFRDKTDEATGSFNNSMSVLGDMYLQAVRQEEMDAKEAEMLARQEARQAEMNAQQAEMDAKQAEMIAREEAFNKKMQAQSTIQQQVVEETQPDVEQVNIFCDESSYEPLQLLKKEETIWDKLTNFEVEVGLSKGQTEWLTRIITPYLK